MGRHHLLATQRRQVSGAQPPVRTLPRENSLSLNAE
jgi:hypothetical protein